MPWLDTGIESGTSKGCLQTCPGWIQVSNLEFVVYRYALAGYRNRIWKLSSTDMPWLDTGIESGNGRLHMCPGWRQESDLEMVVYKCALAGYRNQISKLFMQICPGWIQVSNLQLIPHRYALARYRCRIWKLSSTDVPWPDTGIESEIGRASCRERV